MYLGSVERKMPHFTKIFFVEIPSNKFLVPLSAPFPAWQHPLAHAFGDQGGLDAEPVGCCREDE